MARILIINGSYRDQGVTDQVIEIMAESLRFAGAEVDIILLRKKHIEFCLNCRECTQQPGDVPGECVHHDDMQELIDKVEKSDGYILASPTNFGSVTAIFKRFAERLVVYAYWPWGMYTPKYRKAKASKKKAVLVSSCAAPGFLGRLVFGARKQLNATAKTIGADTVGALFTGLVATEPNNRLSAKVQAKARALALKLI